MTDDRKGTEGPDMSKDEGPSPAEQFVKFDGYEIAMGSLDGIGPPTSVALRFTIEDRVIVLMMTPEKALCLAKDLLDSYVQTDRSW
jgi:hypothetical protein